MDRTGGGVAIETRLDRTRLRFGGRLETRQLNEVDAGALLAGEPWAGMLANADPDDPPWRVQESLVGLVVHDLRDNPLQPRKGALLSANVEWAPGLPWDEVRAQPRTSFLKSEARISGYVPLGGLVLHVAAGGGYIESFAGLVPLEDRFRLGGTGSLRGFVRDAVGPQNITPPLQVDWPNGIGPAIDYALRDNPQRWTPTGGDTNAVGTAELLMPLPALGLSSWEGWAAELFGDVGNAWLLDPSAAPASENRSAPLLRVGIGGGMRIDTPIGPLQLDIALNPQAAAAQGPRKVLLIDEWREPVVRAHLTLGALW
jgi:outer membrane protein assembly factor BamA